MGFWVEREREAKTRRRRTGLQRSMEREKECCVFSGLWSGGSGFCYVYIYIDRYSSKEQKQERRMSGQVSKRVFLLLEGV